jgi:hypothetical protein
MVYGLSSYRAAPDEQLNLRNGSILLKKSDASREGRLSPNQGKSGPREINALAEQIVPESRAKGFEILRCRVFQHYRPEAAVPVLHQAGCFQAESSFGSVFTIA